MHAVVVFLELLCLSFCYQSLAQGTEPRQWNNIEYTLNNSFELDCKPGGGAVADSYKWKANDTAVTANSTGGHYELRDSDSVLHVDRSTEDDWGNYTCFVFDTPALGFRVRAKPELSLPETTSATKGEDVTLTCGVRGRPYPVVWWTSTLSDNTTRNVTVGVQPSAAGVLGAELNIRKVSSDDAGLYTCRALDAAPASTTLTVQPSSAMQIGSTYITMLVAVPLFLIYFHKLD